MRITDQMISAALNAPTLGASHSYVCDYITSPDYSSDDDWLAIGGYTSGVHPSHMATDWQWHIVQRILEAALDHIGQLEK